MDYTLSERAEHTTAVVGTLLYQFAGNQPCLPKVHDGVEKRKLTSTVQLFSLTSGKWSQRPTTGTPPLGVRGYTCKAIGDKLYYFGGWCNHGDCFHNSINQLDTTNLKWTELVPTDPARPVMRRAWSGMITIKLLGVYHLLIIGGMGAPPAIQLPHMKYMKLPSGKYRTNEHSLFNILTGEWSSPSISGLMIPPINGCTIEQINNNRAILFGGHCGTSVNNTVYILDIETTSDMCWQSLKTPYLIDRWPEGRWYHASTIITGSISPILVIMGGWDQKNEVLDELWLLDINTNSWTKVYLPLHFIATARWGHSLSSFKVGPRCVWLLTVGGKDKKGGFVNDSHITVLIELIQRAGQWVAGDVLDSNSLDTNIYRQKYLRQKMEHQPVFESKNHTSFEKDKEIDQAFTITSNPSIQPSDHLKEEEELQLSFQQSHEEKEEELPRQLWKKEKELQLFDQQLQEKEKELQLLNEQLKEREEKLQLFQEQLKEKEVELLLSHQNLERKENELHRTNQQLGAKGVELRATQQQLIKTDNELKFYQQQFADTQKKLEVAHKQSADVQKELEVSHKQFADAQTELEVAHKQQVDELNLSLKQLKKEKEEEHSSLMRLSRRKESQHKKYCQSLEEQLELSHKQLELSHKQQHETERELELSNKEERQFFRDLNQKKMELQLSHRQLQNKKEELLLSQQQLEEKEKELQLSLHQLEEKGEWLLLAHQQLEEKNKGLLLTCQQLEEKEEQLLLAHQQLEEKEEELLLSHQQLERKEEQLLLAHQQLEEKDEELLLSSQQLQEKKEELQLAHHQLEEKDEELLLYNKELEERVEELELCKQQLQERQPQQLTLELEEKERELQLSTQQLEEKERELQLSTQQLEERDRELLVLNQELDDKKRQYNQSQETVRVQQTLFQDQQDNWVIDKDEVIITDEMLGEGAYGNVKVGIFRGLRVAVKLLHKIIISPYNLDLFTREMSIASKVRHPNLVQFIGATKVGNPLILTELMTTSLHKELHNQMSLARPQIVSISRDVALGLNYLHLMKPHPIIHRDVSSPNVLLEPSVGGFFKAKVTDYGAANIFQHSRTDMPGNPSYAAPEARYPDDHSPSMDIYSYCVLLMEITLHRPPAMTIPERSQQALSITNWPPIKSLILSGLNSDRRARPSMTQILDILKET